MFRCENLEDLLASDDPREVAVARQHALGCGRCAETVAVWDEISEAAKSMRREWASADLWSVVQRRAEEARIVSAESQWSRRVAMALAATLLIATTSGFWILRHRGETTVAIDRQLLSEQALRDIERAESDYASSIDRLSALAAPAVNDDSSPLRLAQKEKLLLLDAAIAQCRDAIAANRFNTHLRQELLAMYREKRLTLEEIINEPRSGS